MSVICDDQGTPTFKYYTFWRGGRVWMLDIDWAIHKILLRAEVPLIYKPIAPCKSKSKNVFFWTGPSKS